MDDLPHLISLLRASPQPLTEEEEETLQKIKKALDTTTTTSEHTISDLVPQEINSIPEPSLKIAQTNAPDSNTLFSNKNVISVSSHSKNKTISSAIETAPENSTILISSGTYTEQLTINVPLHFVAKGNVKLDNIHFILRSSLLTLEGFEITSDSEIFTLNRGHLALSKCVISNVSQTRPIIVLTSTATVEMIGCTCTAQHIIETPITTSLTFLNSTLNGTLTFCKSEATFSHCVLDGHDGPTIECIGSNVKILNTTIQGSSNVGLTIRERSQFTINNTIVTGIHGVGILVHGFSGLNGQCIRFISCEQAALIVANDAQAKITDCSIVNCGHTGCEVLSQGSLELTETWISNSSSSCILCDEKSFFNATKCRITKSQRHGIEAGNGSTLRLNDTIIDDCKYFGVLLTNSKLTGKSCEFRGNKDTNFYADDHSWVELTNCNFLKSGGDGLSADTESMVICNHNFFNENEGYGVTVLSCRDAKFQTSVFHKNKQGGLFFESTKQMVIDECIINSNSMTISSVDNSVIRLTSMNHASTKFGDKSTQHVDILNKSNVTFEENTFLYSTLKVKNSTATIRQNKISHASSFAINGEYAHLTIESNELFKNRAVLYVKDNSDVHFFNNKISNVLPKSKSDPNKQRVIYIKAFTKGSLDGNTINGEYDYAIAIDGQSNIDARANQIQCGSSGTILYTGVSSGVCEDNSFTGKALAKPIWVTPGCNVIIRSPK
ncbi:AAA family ATPase [Histomonas meleagridis]|uniref:AAA family ATPase n=1 Tax=Histomonas meleagridis TaxID=135588 RepID=UPI00355A7787|nr:AAA family ATPase [Histomonas meleagridis]KAH0805370.1 AAA family ATPase [Histomonas meleagridis]